MDKLCRRCGTEQDLETGFHKKTKSKDGHQQYCKKCMIKIARSTTREERRARDPERYQQRQQASGQRYRTKHRERYNAVRLAYYYEHREQVLQRQRLRRAYVRYVLGKAPLTEERLARLAKNLTSG